MHLPGLLHKTPGIFSSVYLTKLIFRKSRGRVCTGLTWVRIGNGGRLLLTCRFIKQWLLLTDCSMYELSLGTLVHMWCLVWISFFSYWKVCVHLCQNFRDVYYHNNLTWEVIKFVYVISSIPSFNLLIYNKHHYQVTVTWLFSQHKRCLTT